MVPRAALLSALAIIVLTAAPAQAAGYHREAQIALPDGGWDYASFDPVLRRVYVARAGSVTMVEVDSGKVAALAAVGRSHQVLPLNKGGELLVTDATASAARIFDTGTGAELASVTVGAKPDAAIFDPSTGLVLVMNAKSGTVSLVDPSARKAVGEVALEPGLEFAVADGAGHAFVNNEDKNDITVIDLKSRAVTGKIALTGCEEPSGLAYDAAAKRLIAACANKQAAVVDPATGKLDGLIAIGEGPDAVLYDAGRKLAFIPCGRSGELDVIAADADGKLMVIDRVKTALGARTGALDAKTGKLYLPAADYDPPATPGGRPPIRPGTVVLVVVAP